MKTLIAVNSVLIAVLLLGPFSSRAGAASESLAACAANPYTCQSPTQPFNIGMTNAFSVAAGQLSNVSGCTFYVKGGPWFQLGLSLNNGNSTPAPPRQSQCDWDTINQNTLDSVLSAALNTQYNTTRSVQCATGSGGTPLTASYGRDHSACN
jgi:hypothetical protein